MHRSLPLVPSRSRPDHVFRPTLRTDTTTCRRKNILTAQSRLQVNPSESRKRLRFPTPKQTDLLGRWPMLLVLTPALGFKYLISNVIYLVVVMVAKYAFSCSAI